MYFRDKITLKEVMLLRSKDVLQLLRVTRQTLSKYDENSEEKPRERRARTNAHEALTSVQTRGRSHFACLQHAK